MREQVIVLGNCATRLTEAITPAIEDLRVLPEVPLGELESSIAAIADRLADQNVEVPQ